MTTGNITQAGATVWAAVDVSTQLRATQIGATIWLTVANIDNSPTPPNQWNPVFPDKPGNGNGGSGPPGQNKSQGGRSPALSVGAWGLDLDVALQREPGLIPQGSAGPVPPTFIPVLPSVIVTQRLAAHGLGPPVFEIASGPYGPIPKLGPTRLSWVNAL